MRRASRMAAMLMATALVAGSVQFAMAAGGTVSPVLDRIQAKKELVVGTAADMPPLNMTTKDGQIIGLEVDIASLFAGGMGVKLTLTQVKFNDLLPALEAGQVDMVLSGMTILPERNLRTAFVGPYFASGKSILTKAANADALSDSEKINNPDKVLVTLKGSTSQLFVERAFPKAKLVLTDDYDQAVAMVRDDKAHAMVADYPICQVSVFRYPGAKLATLKNPISYEPLGIALPAGDPLLVNLVQNMLSTLEKSGELELLMQKWFKDSSWVKSLP
jgi:polar amino acid transport system substrate-binding protein